MAQNAVKRKKKKDEKKMKKIKKGELNWNYNLF